ncbi:MAG: hypothetical protein KJ709_03195 [Nanoarchaeota archaeon]|nr:hypothetical protein [Nanoarchaeota archaeon]
MVKAKVVKESGCCMHGFPTFATVLLVIGLIWLLNELKVFTVDIPWIPIVLMVIAIGMIVNRMKK